MLTRGRRRGGLCGRWGAVCSVIGIYGEAGRCYQRPCPVAGMGECCLPRVDAIFSDGGRALVVVDVNVSMSSCVAGVGIRLDGDRGDDCRNRYSERECNSTNG